ncbi:pilus assembly protein PilO [Geobacillus jurassicus]|uniref:Pilus assembly protein PilO n=1 Tax=Geobacillus jurassicus TaxID=235932 RepID=A0ABV6GRS7_9BACL|nr:pilus assembly protein PilO [Geobacillus jurassicus]
MMGRFGKWPLVFTGVFLLAALLFAAVYVFVLLPRYEQIDRLEAVVQSEKNVLAAMKKQAAVNREGTAESLAALQRKVPVRPFADQLLLAFQKAEYISDSRLLSVSFAEGQGAGEAASQGNGNETENKASGNGAPALPSGIQSITAQLTVQSPSYYQLERFLEVLEQSERIVAIEGLTVTGPPELTSTADEVQPLTYSVTVRAFYAPKLEKWKQLAPVRDVPPPSGKDNPFAEMAPAS